MPRKCLVEAMVRDAVRSEPVSGVEFPDTWEFTANCYVFATLEALEVDCKP